MEQSYKGLQYDKNAITKIWNILGITTYEQAKGKSIDELVKQLKAENKKLHDLFEHINGDEYGYQIYDRYKESIKESDG